MHFHTVIHIGFKILLLGVLATVTFAYVRTIATGRLCARVPSLSSEYHNRSAARIFLILLTTLVVLIEIGRLLTRHTNHDLFFWIHLFFAAPLFLSSLALYFRFDGERWRNDTLMGGKWPYHRWLAYATVPMFIGTFVTGVPMILFRF